MIKLLFTIAIVLLTLNECFSSPNQIHARPKQRHRPQFKFEKSSNNENDNNNEESSSSSSKSSPTKLLNAQNSDKCPKLIKNKPCEYECSIEKENDCGGKFNICCLHSCGSACVNLKEKVSSNDEEETKPCLSRTENESELEKTKLESSSRRKVQDKSESSIRDKGYSNPDDDDEDEDEDSEDKEDQVSEDELPETPKQTKPEPRRPSARIRVTQNEILNNQKPEALSKMKKKFNYIPNEDLDDTDYSNFNNLNQYNSLIGNSMLKQHLSSGINGGMTPFDQMNNIYGYNMPNMDFMNNMGGYMGMNTFDQANNYAPLKTGINSNFKSFNLKSKKRDGKKRFDVRVLDSLNN